jgi:hypothetical protein
LKTVPLTRGYYAIVDDEDYFRVSVISWFAKVSSNGKTARAVGNIKGKKVPMSRFLLNATAGSVVDHIDGNPLNNQKKNLRICSQSQNLMNQRVRDDNSSGVKGVSYHKQSMTWHAYIQVNGKRKNIGFFYSKDEAISARREAETKVYGEYARQETSSASS